MIWEDIHAHVEATLVLLSRPITKTVKPSNGASTLPGGGRGEGVSD